MARSATKRRPAAPKAAEGEINPKAPCPCGSGRRYKHCHGSGYAPPVTRPFEGLPGEPDWGALRQLVPAAPAPLKLANGREVTLASVLPGGSPALVRAEGEILLGVQLAASSDDISRDLGTALGGAPDAPVGAPARPGPPRRPGPRPRPPGAARGRGRGRAAAPGAARPVGTARGHRAPGLRLLA